MTRALAIFALLASALSCSHAVGRPAAKGSVSSEPFLEGLARVPVEGHAEAAPFHVAARVPHLPKMPCTRCHSVPLERMRPVKPAAHWTILLKHAKPETMNCQTCHAEPSRGELRLLQGAAVGFDHAYRVCGQCHAAQERDWAGGAHGKRAAGWAPPRVSLSCTACHNPHAPAFDRRWPARAGRPEPME